MNLASDMGQLWRHEVGYLNMVTMPAMAIFSVDALAMPLKRGASVKLALVMNQKIYRGKGVVFRAGFTTAMVVLGTKQPQGT